MLLVIYIHGYQIDLFYKINNEKDCVGLSIFVVEV